MAGTHLRKLKIQDGEDSSLTAKVTNELELSVKSLSTIDVLKEILIELKIANQYNYKKTDERFTSEDIEED